jgi:transposase InsO family protein
MIDYFTKAAEFAVVYTKDPAAVARAFYYSWVCTYSVPAYVTSDNGTEFNEEFVHLLKRLGITHIHISVAHPAANGVVERLVKQFKAMLLGHMKAHPQPLVAKCSSSYTHAVYGSAPFSLGDRVLMRCCLVVSPALHCLSAPLLCYRLHLLVSLSSLMLILRQLTHMCNICSS